MLWVYVHNLHWNFCLQYHHTALQENLKFMPIPKCKTWFYGFRNILQISRGNDFQKIIGYIWHRFHIRYLTSFKVLFCTEHTTLDLLVREYAGHEMQEACFKKWFPDSTKDNWRVFRGEWNGNRNDCCNKLEHKEQFRDYYKVIYWHYHRLCKVALKL